MREQDPVQDHSAFGEDRFELEAECGSLVGLSGQDGPARAAGAASAG